MTGLRCVDLSFKYRRNSEEVISHLTVDFPQGALTAVTGPSGSGKSTLMYVLSLLLRPTSGEIYWNAQNLTVLSDGQGAHWRTNTVGFVFQDAMLDPSRSVLENVCEPAVFTGMPPHVAHARARSLLAEFNLAERATHRPGEVSGGQAQRVGLCRALLTNPPLIFGDEPTGNLDSENGSLVWQALADSARAGATVIVATHDEALAATADHRLRLL